MRIATGPFRQGMGEQLASLVTGHHDALDQFEVLARLRFVPGRAPWRQRHQMERRVVHRVANDATRMTGPLGQENGLYLGFEELEIQRWRCSRGRSRLIASLAHRLAQ